jgi:hypothetical protein
MAKVQDVYTSCEELVPEGMLPSESEVDANNQSRANGCEGGKVQGRADMGETML